MTYQITPTVATALTQEIALARAMAAHSDKKFLWDRFKYVNARTKVEIGCPVHGYFQATYDSVQRGSGCRKCGYSTPRKSSSYSTEEFVAKIKDVILDCKGNAFDYSKTSYVNRSTKVTVTCNLHGDFEMHPGNSLSLHNGCPKCGVEMAHRLVRKPLAEVSRSIAEVLDTSKYKLLETAGYAGTHSYITMSCIDHGPWLTKPNWILSRGTEPGFGSCPSCSNKVSSGERQVRDFVKEIYKGELVLNSRREISPLELDIFLPELNLAIEYHGLYWHSEKAGKHEKTHLEKLKACQAKGIRLIQIYEDEWSSKQETVKSRIRHLLGVNSEGKLYARKLRVNKMGHAEANEFFSKNHIQGFCSSQSHCVGLYEGETLVSAMSFGIVRFGQREPGTYELLRFASSKAVAGGFSRLLAAFIRETSAKKILSFSDKRWSQGNVYLKNGFKFVRTSAPGYDYCTSSAKRFNRQTFMKHKMASLVEKGVFKTFDEKKTEVENCHDNGFFRIWNCGMDLWEYRVEQPQA